MKQVIIAGAGALGSHVALFLRNHAHLKVVDMDRVEQKNTLSQFHSTMSVGKNKANALKDVLKFLYGTKVEAIPHEIRDDNVMNIMDKADLYIDCLDNSPARLLVQGVATYRKIACLHGGLAADGGFGRILWDEEFLTDEGAGGATCEDGEHLPFIAGVASLMARTAQEYLKSGKKMSFSVFPSGDAKRII